MATATTAVNAASKRLPPMIGLRRWLWPMMGDAGLVPCKPCQRNAELHHPSPRLDRDPLGPRGERRRRAMDRGAPAGGDRAAWPASAVAYRRADRASLFGPR